MRAPFGALLKKAWIRAGLHLKTGQVRASPGNARIDVYHMGVCAEDPPFLSQIDVFGWGSNRKKITKRAL